MVEAIRMAGLSEACRDIGISFLRSLEDWCTLEATLTSMRAALVLALCQRPHTTPHDS